MKQDGWSQKKKIILKFLCWLLKWTASSNVFIDPLLWKKNEIMLRWIGWRRGTAYQSFYKPIFDFFESLIKFIALLHHQLILNVSLDFVEIRKEKGIFQKVLAQLNPSRLQFGFPSRIFVKEVLVFSTFLICQKPTDIVRLLANSDANVKIPIFDFFFFCFANRNMDTIDS